MDRIEIRMRRRSALGLVCVSVIPLAIGVGALLVEGASGRHRWLPTGALAMPYIMPAVFGLVLGVRELAHISTPRAMLDNRGITFPGVGLIDWTDVCAAEVVRIRRRTPRVRIDVQNWEKYYARHPRWVRWLDRRPVRGEIRPINLLLGDTGVEPDVLCDTIRRHAGRPRAQAV